VPSRDHFSLSHSSRWELWGKHFTSRGPDPHNAGHYEVFHLHYWIQLSSAIPRYMESITLPEHSHVSNTIISLIQRRSLRMEADISACWSQQSSVVIRTLTRESQRANHAVIEISMTRTISHDSHGIYTPRTSRKGRESKSI